MNARFWKNLRALCAEGKNKMRLDKYLALHGFSSRTKAARAIAEGRVFLNGKVASAADEVREGDALRIEESEVSFVSEGGFKLYKALADFHESVAGCVFADIGASTGGFTDCLLQGGVGRVYAVDVGESQLDHSLKEDGRVVVMDGVNARGLNEGDFPETLDGVTADVSFISLKLVLPALARIVRPGGRVFALVKPQFECGAAALNKHGIVKDAAAREKALLSVTESAALCGLYAKKITNAPVKERKNIEYVVLFDKEKAGCLPREAIVKASRTLT